MTLTNAPIYLQPVKGTEVGFRALLQRAKASSYALPTLAAGSTSAQSRNALVVEVRNPQTQAITTNLKVSVPNGEFNVTSPIQPVTVAAESSKSVLLPIQNKGQWQTASVHLQASVGSQNIEKKIEVKPLKSLPCPRLKNAVVLDGTINEAEWKDANRFQINRADQLKEGKAESWGDVDDLSGAGYVKYDAQALYLALRVRDDKRVAIPQNAPFYDRESIELFLDAKPDENVGSTLYQAGTSQLVYAVPHQQEKALGWWRSSASDKNFDVSQIKSAFKLREDGYEVEFAIPWNQLKGFKAIKGANIGFDLALDDTDNTPHREKQLVWVGGSTNYADRTLFGRLILK